MNFDIAFDRLIGNEGGYSNDPADPGGETNWGISKRAYPDVDIKNLTREGAKAIYKRDLWDRAHMAQYDGAVAFQLFDFAVNSGIETAVRYLQRAAGVADDGHVGPATLQALRARPPQDLLVLYAAERLDFLRRLKNWPHAGAGWAGRIAANLRYAVLDLDQEATR